MNSQELLAVKHAIVRFGEETYTIKKLENSIYGEVIGTPLDPEARPTHSIKDKHGTVIVVLFLPNKNAISFLEQVPPNSSLWISANEPTQYKHLHTIVKTAVLTIKARKENKDKRG
jgi:hypothetical protein